MPIYNHLIYMCTPRLMKQCVSTHGDQVAVSFIPRTKQLFYTNAIWVFEVAHNLQLSFQIVVQFLAVWIFYTHNLDGKKIKDAEKLQLNIQINVLLIYLDCKPFTLLHGLIHVCLSTRVQLDKAFVTFVSEHFQCFLGCYFTHLQQWNNSIQFTKLFVFIDFYL